MFGVKNMRGIYNFFAGRCCLEARSLARSVELPSAAAYRVEVEAGVQK